MRSLKLIHAKKIILGIAILSFSLILVSCPEVDTVSYDKVEFTLRSSAFSDGGAIPEKYYASGSNATSPPAAATNTSIPFSWEHAPDAVESFLFLMFDVDLDTQQHWFLYNIDKSVSSIAEGINSSYPSNLTVMKGSKSSTGYWGPDASAGSTKTYRFVVFALGSSNITISTEDSGRISGNNTYKSWSDSSNLGYQAMTYITGVNSVFKYEGATYTVLGVASMTGTASF